MFTKLTAETVLEIRALLKQQPDGISDRQHQTNIANQFSVSRTSINNIAIGKSWKDGWTPESPRGSFNERFDRKVVKSPLNDCWLWIGAIGADGYGNITDGVGVCVRSHRASYERYRGSIPEGMIVCHTCDTPRCVNPEHLFLGTVIDNVVDKMNKGRQAKGEVNGMSKLKEKDVLEIRELYKKKYTQQRIADLYKVSQMTINVIVNGKSWTHLT